jgi:outer membrane protein OmpA-like peptidoglycan-associated protein
MKPAIHAFSLAACVVLFVFASGISSQAEDGQLNIRVTPKQAYVFVDGYGVSEASRYPYLHVSAGEHKVDLRNYGYMTETRTVTITAGRTTRLDVTLTPVLATVNGPFGAMTIEGAGYDAVLLNGKTPDFFVGHGDEFDHDWWWKQELVVPSGTYQVTILQGDKERWTGSVNLPANQRVVVDIPKGVRKTVAWPRGEKLASVPRFAAGVASTTVAVAKPTAGLSITASQINCGDSSQLKWTSTDAPQVVIAPMGPVPVSGEQAVQPKQTTTYQIAATGPGGTATSNATVNVNTAVQAKLELAPAEVRYKRVGDKILEESNTALNWTAANASTVSIDSLGTVGQNGSHPLQIAPRRTDPGPVDETVTYTLNATNECGGASTQTATLHIIGSIEPMPELVMRSIYFPTDLPTAHHAQAGLLSSEQETLKSIAEAFQRYVAITPGARLTLSGHADKRGPGEYNHDLSERRVQLVQNFLIEQGVSAQALETNAYGDDQNLSAEEVKQLLQQNLNLTDEDRQTALERLETIVLSNNRRVDITLSTTGQESLRQYPYKSEDFAKLVDRNGPRTRSAVQLASKKEKIAN